IATSDRLGPRAILRGRCLGHGEGRAFGDASRPDGRRPVRGPRFGREPGDFLGAVLLGYIIVFPILLAGVLLRRRLIPGLPLPWAFLAGCCAFLPAAPAVSRIARALFIHLDRSCDPDDPGG